MGDHCVTRARPAASSHRAVAVSGTRKRRAPRRHTHAQREPSFSHRRPSPVSVPALRQRFEDVSGIFNRHAVDLLLVDAAFFKGRNDVELQLGVRRVLSDKG
jgi:hypothetical protein